MNTTYFLNLVAGNVFRTKTTPAIPTTYYYGVSKTAPNISGGNVSEPSGGGYKRVPLGSLSAPTNGVITNTAPVSFDESTTAWGTVTHFVVYDAQTGGNLLMYGPLETSRTVEKETVLTAKTGKITLTVANQG